MTTPPARGGQAKPVEKNPPRPPVLPSEVYAKLPSTAKIGLRSIPPGRSVDLILDADPPVMSGGGGGWQVTPRWGRKGLTSWQGVDPYTLTFTALLDAKFAGKEDVESDVDELEAMYAPRGDFNAPRHLRVVGASPGTDKEWLFTGLVWQSSLRTSDGKRRIAPCEITLMEFVSPDSVIRPTKRAQDASNRKRLYTVKAGDTLTSIAKKQLGDASLADDIRRENLPALRDPRSLKAKMVILLPSGKLHKS
jgi:nucleoid-associated protein YgaU